MAGRQARLHLHDALERRDGLRGLLLCQMDAPAHQQRLEVGGMLLEHGLQRGDAVVVATFRERDLGEPAPRGQVLGILRRDRGEHGLGLLALASPDVELGELQARRRAVRRELRGHLQLFLGRVEVARQRVVLRQRRVRRHRLRIAGDGLLERLERLRRVVLLHVERAERDVELCAVGERGPRALEPHQRGLDVLGPRRRVGQQHERVEVLGVALEDVRRVCAR
ncbi:MAG: hypothetical protein DME02_23395, partial [Candidatus Rokuibacteriota bacterium]